MSRLTSLRRPATWLLSLSVLALLAWVLISARGHIVQSYSLKPAAVLLMSVATIGILALRAIAHRITFRRVGISASLHEWFALIALTALSNQLPIPAGLAAKGFYLKRTHGLPYSVFAKGQIAILLGFTSVNGLVGLATLYLWMQRSDVWIVGLACLVISLAGAPLFIRLPLPERWRERLEFTPGQEIPKIFWATVGLPQLPAAFLFALKLHLAFQMGPHDVSFSACLLFSAVAVGANRIAFLTPGAIGVREFLVGGVAYLMGVEWTDAVIATAIDRAVELLVILPLGGVSSWSLSRKLLSQSS